MGVASLRAATAGRTRAANPTVTRRTRWDSMGRLLVVFSGILDPDVSSVTAPFAGGSLVSRPASYFPHRGARLPLLGRRAHGLRAAHRLADHQHAGRIRVLWPGARAADAHGRRPREPRPGRDAGPGAALGRAATAGD